MAHPNQRAGRLYADADLFAELAPESRRHRLAGLELASGELPQAGQVDAVGSSGDEHAGALVEQRARDDVQDLGVSFDSRR